MADAMKIHLKKNAAANGLALNERLQGLTATDVTHSRKSIKYGQILALSHQDLQRALHSAGH